MDETITLTLTRREAEEIAARIRDLHHNAFPPAVDVAMCDEPLRWVLEGLAVALREYGLGVRPSRAPRTDRTQPPQEVAP